MLVLATVGCGDPGGGVQGPLDERDAVVPSADVLEDDAEVEVYRVEWSTDAAGVTQEWDEQGVFDDWLRQRVARPWLHLSEGALYHDMGWWQQQPDGTERGAYWVTRTTVDPASLPPPPTPTKVGIAPSLQDHLSSVADGTTPVEIIISTDLPAGPPLPLLPPRASVSAQDMALAVEERQEQSAANLAAFTAASGGLTDAIVEVGGTVERRSWRLGAVVATVASAAVPDIADRAEVVRVSRGDAVSEDAACTTDAGQQGGDAVSLGDLRVYTRAQDYNDLGYHGQPSSGQEVLLGIVESQEHEDEACFFADNSNCNPSRRLRTRRVCTSAGCGGNTNFAAAEEHFHGTVVSSIAMGAYDQNQGDDHEASIAPGLGIGWRDAATNFAQEVEGHYYAAESTSAKISAYECAMGDAGCPKVEIANLSHGNTDGWCDADSNEPIEAAAEEMFDDGLLVVGVPHNDNNYWCLTNPFPGCTGADFCFARDPGDNPKVFTVGALEPDDALPYGQWRYAGYSNRGKGPFTTGFFETDTNSIIDLVAAGQIGYITFDDGDYGEVKPDGICLGTEDAAGTSYAAPQVAAAAAIVKHRALDLGWTWIENNGRLHTMMLAMGDRGSLVNGSLSGATNTGCVFGTGNDARIRCGSDNYMGLGRLHLNFHNHQSHFTWTFTSSTGSRHWQLFGGNALESSDVIVKCVLQQFEDMSDQDDMSQVRLQVDVRGNGIFGCSLGGSSLLFSRFDNERDDKHMVTIVDTEQDLSGKCVEVKLDVQSLSDANKVTVNLFCYSDDELDYG